jgi:hypothetical protein
MTAIPILFSFARSGGTLVNQLLGVHPDCLVLSEVNPAASFMPVVEQAVEWLGLVEKPERNAFDALPYHEQIGTLDRRAAARDKQLVVRDWVTVNFLPGTARDGTMPSGQLEQCLYLEHGGMQPRPLVIARRAAAVYRSIRRSFAHLRDLEPDAFAAAYLSYAHSVAGLPTIHLEELRGAPAKTLERVLLALGLEATPPDTLLGTFHGFRNCTGNTTLATAGDSTLWERILPPEASGPDTEPAPPVREALAQADCLLGYARD